MRWAFFFVFILVSFSNQPALSRVYDLSDGPTQTEQDETLNKINEALSNNSGLAQWENGKQVKDKVFGSPKREEDFNKCLVALKGTEKFIEQKRPQLKPDAANGLRGWLRMMNTDFVEGDNPTDAEPLPDDLKSCLIFNANDQTIYLLQKALADQLPTSPREALVSCGAGLATLTWAYEETQDQSVAFKVEKKMGEDIGATASIIINLYKGYDDMRNTSKEPSIMSEIGLAFKEYKEASAEKKLSLLNTHLHDCESLGIPVGPYIWRLPPSLQPSYKYTDERMISDDLSFFADIYDVFGRRLTMSETDQRTKYGVMGVAGIALLSLVLYLGYRLRSILGFLRRTMRK